LKHNTKIFKFEMLQTGQKHSLIVKNVTKDDFCQYSVELLGGEKKDAKLEKKKPFLKPIDNTEGYIGDISVFQCQVHLGTQVTWYFGSKKINRQNFR